MKLASVKRRKGLLGPILPEAPDRTVTAPDVEPQSGVTVLIRDLSVGTVIGVHARERGKSQSILIDLDIELAASRAGETDHLADTVDYAAVVDDLRACLSDKRYFLLERLAEFVADRILTRFGAVRVGVSIAKVGILKDVGLVGVSIERRRSLETEAPGRRQPSAASRLTFVKKK